MYTTWLKRFTVATALFGFLDLIWIRLYMSGVYSRVVRDIQNAELTIDPMAAVAAYLALFIGIGLAVWGTKNAVSAWEAVIFSGLLGAAIYGAYAYTNVAIFDGFPAVVALYEVAWGFVVFAVSVGIAFKVFPEDCAWRVRV